MAYPKVVLYHSVVADDSPADSFAGKHPTREQLAAHLDYLKSRYRFVSAKEFVALYEGRSRASGARPPCLLTFDDGHAGLLANALPVLEAHRVPCVIFVVAGTLGEGPAPWYISADYLVRAAEGRTIQYRGRAFDCTSVPGAATLKAAFKRRYVKLTSGDEREAALEELAHAVGKRPPDLADLPEDMAFLRPEQVKALSRHELIAIGSHGLTHKNLSTLSAEEQERELGRSAEILAALTGVERMMVSYPDSSHNATTRELASRYYQFGFAVELHASRRDRFAYPRTCLGRMSVKGLKYWLSWRRRYVFSHLRRLLGRG